MEKIPIVGIFTLIIFATWDPLPLFNKARIQTLCLTLITPLHPSKLRYIHTTPPKWNFSTMNKTWVIFFFYSRKIYELRFWFKMKKKKYQEFSNHGHRYMQLNFHSKHTKIHFCKTFCEKLLAIIYNSVFMLYYEWWWKIINAFAYDEMNYICWFRS